MSTLKSFQLTAFHFSKESQSNLVCKTRIRRKIGAAMEILIQPSHSQYNNIPICRAAVQQQVCSVLRLEALAHCLSLVCIICVVVSSPSKGLTVRPKLKFSHNAALSRKQALGFLSPCLGSPLFPFCAEVTCKQQLRSESLITSNIRPIAYVRACFSGQCQSLMCCGALQSSTVCLMLPDLRKAIPESWGDYVGGMSSYLRAACPCFLWQGHSRTRLCLRGTITLMSGYISSRVGLAIWNPQDGTCRWRDDLDFHPPVS